MTLQSIYEAIQTIRNMPKSLPKEINTLTNHFYSPLVHHMDIRLTLDFLGGLVLDQSDTFLMPLRT